VVLYEMLAGVPPFTEDSTEAVLRAQLQREPTPLRQIVDLPEDIESVVMRCLRKDPAERFQTMEELGNQLSALLLRWPSDGAAGTLARLSADGLEWQRSVELVQRDSTMFESLQAVRIAEPAVAPPPSMVPPSPPPIVPIALTAADESE